MSGNKMADVTVLVTFQDRNGSTLTRVCLINGAELLIDLTEKAREALITQHNVEQFRMKRLEIMV